MKGYNTGRKGLLRVACTMLVAGATFGAGMAVTGAQSPAHEHHSVDAAPPPVLRDDIHGPVPSASRAPTAAFDGAGRLWLVWVESRYVLVSSSSDSGRSFEPAIRVNPAPEDVDANSESRPKIAVGPLGQIYVSYTRAGVKPYTGDIRFARSLDHGRTFSAPVTVNDDGLETGHRFDTLAVGQDGRVMVAWIDKRDLDEAGRAGRPYDGAALYYAVSSDEGRSFGRNRKLKDGICECCRIVSAVVPGGRIALLWRDILPGGIRDHSITSIGADLVAGPVTRATRDGWAINACPHHGPALAIARDGTYHAVWFTGAGPAGAGTFYARSTDGGRSFNAPRPVGQSSAPSHATVYAAGRRVWIAWKQPGGPEGTSVFAERSDDNGITWGPARMVASTTGASDHPFLVGGNGDVFLSWFTAGEGYRLVRLDERHR
jgi:hypothetical protein